MNEIKTKTSFQDRDVALACSYLDCWSPLTKVESRTRKAACAVLLMKRNNGRVAEDV